ncbi:sensor histidine kinase [Paenibacillus sp. FSL R5-0517]|uniref:sensor histidine kinase n=1 Tax=Paenibacillus sp. FSL R5-0517 TaxID=2921647 RepID=UPI0030D70DAE
MRISTKMFIGYVLLIVLPFLVFFIFWYVQMYDKLVLQYQQTNQKNLEQVAGHAEETLSKIEALQSIYQNNAALIDYLRDTNMEDRDMIYYYLRDISPAISFAKLAETNVQSISIYPKLQERLLNVPGFFPYDALDAKLTTAEISTLRPLNGQWKHVSNDKNIILTYYHKIYSDLYTTDLGMLEIEVHPLFMNHLLNQMIDIHPENEILVFNEEGKLVGEPKGTMLSSDEVSMIGNEVLTLNSHAFESEQGKLLINHIELPRLGLRIVEVANREIAFDFLRVKLLLLSTGLGMLGILSVLYYLIVSSMTKRVIKLSRHMRKVGLDTLGSPYTGTAGSDEIGYMITSYNAMMVRMDELVNKVQREELLKKEAEFRMLQAQIQPHFLYNTLETIRMLARSDRGTLVAEIALSLGKLLRYSLSSRNDAILRDEYDHVCSYMSIHQIRMKELHLHIDVDESILSVACPRFILQPLVENSILHGLSRKRGSGRISLSIKREGCAVRIQITDNGAGIESERLAILQQVLSTGSVIEDRLQPKGLGIGLANVVARVRAYFGPGTEMLINSRPGVETTVTLKLDVEVYTHAEIDDCG